MTEKEIMTSGETVAVSFDADLQRILSLRRGNYLTVHDGLSVALDFIDKLWAEYSRRGNEIERLRAERRGLVHRACEASGGTCMAFHELSICGPCTVENCEVMKACLGPETGPNV